MDTERLLRELTQDSVKEALATLMTQGKRAQDWELICKALQTHDKAFEELRKLRVEQNRLEKEAVMGECIRMFGLVALGESKKLHLLNPGKLLQSTRWAVCSTVLADDRRNSVFESVPVGYSLCKSCSIWAELKVKKLAFWKKWKQEILFQIWYLILGGFMTRGESEEHILHLHAEVYDVPLCKTKDTPVDPRLRPMRREEHCPECMRRVSLEEIARRTAYSS